jgi:site-specific DNA-adenine methylase
MDPVIINRGGKRKEINSFIQFIPAYYDRYIETFFGKGIILSFRAS